MQESTFLSRSFADQGLKIRIRKELRRPRKKPGRRKDSEEEDASADEDKTGKRLRKEDRQLITGPSNEPSTDNSVKDTSPIITQSSAYTSTSYRSTSYRPTTSPSAADISAPTSCFTTYSPERQRTANDPLFSAAAAAAVARPPAAYRMSSTTTDGRTTTTTPYGSMSEYGSLMRVYREPIQQSDHFPSCSFIASGPSSTLQWRRNSPSASHEQRSFNYNISPIPSGNINS